MTRFQEILQFDVDAYSNFNVLSHALHKYYVTDRIDADKSKPYSNVRHDLGQVTWELADWIYMTAAYTGRTKPRNRSGMPSAPMYGLPVQIMHGRGAKIAMDHLIGDHKVEINYMSLPLKMPIKQVVFRVKYPKTVYDYQMSNPPNSRRQPQIGEIFAHDEFRRVNVNSIQDGKIVIDCECKRTYHRRLPDDAMFLLARPRHIPPPQIGSITLPVWKGRPPCETGESARQQKITTVRLTCDDYGEEFYNPADPFQLNSRVDASCEQLTTALLNGELAFTSDESKQNE